MGTPATIALSHADAARVWLNTRDNPMVVTAVLPLDGPLDTVVLRDLLRARLLIHARFRAAIDLPARPWNLPRWREDLSLSLDRHVARVVLPFGSTEADITRVVSGLASLPLPLDHPPWCAWIIDGVAPGSVLVVRVHHCIADGLALLGVLFAVSDEGAGELSAPVVASDSTRASRPMAAGLFHDAAALGRLLLQRADTSGLLAGRVGARKRITWSPPIDLEAVRIAAHAADAHVNDVILAALAGALRRALGAQPTRPLHALVPIAHAHAPGALGNQFASVFVALPVHLDGPVARLRFVRESVQGARATVGLSLSRTLVDLLGTLGGIVRHAGVWFLSRKASVVASNVPGPPRVLHLGGRAITALHFAAPCPGSIGLSVNVASYAGVLSLTVLADAHLAVPPEALARLFADEVTRLVSLLVPTGAPP